MLGPVKDGEQWTLYILRMLQAQLPKEKFISVDIFKELIPIDLPEDSSSNLKHWKSLIHGLKKLKNRTPNHVLLRKRYIALQVSSKSQKRTVDCLWLDCGKKRERMRENE